MKCCLCKKEIPVEVNGWDQGNNAQPLADGRCCDSCNNKVIAKRIEDIKSGSFKEQLLTAGFKKQIRRIGDSTGIIFSRAEIKKYGLEVGNTLNLDDAFVDRALESQDKSSKEEAKKNNKRG